MEKSDKRASASREQARIVAEEIIERRRRFFKQSAEDKDLARWIPLVETIMEREGNR